jgi:hypothetical protein
MAPLASLAPDAYATTPSMAPLASLAPGALSNDGARLSTPPYDDVDASPLSQPFDSSDANPTSSDDQGNTDWARSEVAPALAPDFSRQDLFATRLELNAPEPHSGATSDAEAHGDTRDAPAAAPHEQPAPPTPSARAPLDLRSGLVLGFAAFTSLASAACLVILLMRGGTTAPAKSELGNEPDQTPAASAQGSKQESGEQEPGERAHADERAEAKHDEQAEPKKLDRDEHAADDEHAEAKHDEGAAKDEPAEEKPTVSAPASASADGHASRTEVRATGGCQIVRPPRRLVRDVSPRVPLEARATPGGEVLLGYAMADGSARAVKFEGDTQRMRELLHEGSMEEVTGVVPLGEVHDTPFVIDRAGHDDEDIWRTLPGSIGFALTKNPRTGIHLQAPGNKRSTPLWPLPASAVPTRPAVAQASAQRYVLTFREDEPRSGQIRFGWLDVFGSHSKLETLPLGAVEIGAPSIAARGDKTMIAVALRDRVDAEWRVELWRAAPGASSRVVIGALQQGEPGDQIAPRISALDGGRWALQWTMGNAGKRHVDLLVLDSALEAMGEPIMLSGVRSSGGAGLLIANAPFLLSFYLVQSSAEKYDLWLRVLNC